MGGSRRAVKVIIFLALIVGLAWGHPPESKFNSLDDEGGSMSSRSESSQGSSSQGVAMVKDFTGYMRAAEYQPRHIHLAYGSNSTTEMVVTWSTNGKPTEAFVDYGAKHLAEMRQSGTTTKFVETSLHRRTQYVHRVTLTKLTPGQTYMYHVGSDQGWSEIFYFTAMRPGQDWSPHLAIYGDLGNDNAISLVRLQKETHMGIYDAIIHVGDFAYDLDSEWGTVGDAFMTQIQPIAGYLPYMVCPGNHEWAWNYFQYKSRFTMPGESKSMFYSWDMGPIHFISLSTEFYYFLFYGIKPVIEQFNWLEKDLEEANKNRAVRPWIIVYGHRPMYCSNANSDDCTKKNSRVRVGLPFLHWYGLEKLFMKHGVDLSIWAHEHSYERLWPMYDHKVHNGSSDEPYRNPRALTHITTGSAGCKEAHDGFTNEKPDWSAFRATDYGFSRMKPLNRTHLYFEQVSEDKNGTVIDSFTLIREQHGPYDIPT